MLLIPAMDLRGGHCVRLFQGDFGAETRYEATAEQLLERYRAWGAEWLHVVDLDGAREGVLANRAIIRALSARRLLRLQVGGGIRSTDALENLLDAGIERAVIGSAALEDPTSVIQWLGRFGPERLCLAFDVRLDARGEPRVRTRGWQDGGAVSLWEAIEPFRALGLRHVLCTDIERDGALSGPNLDLYRRARVRLPELAWQASGGVRDAADLHALAALDVHAAISGKALLEQHIPLQELRPFLPNASSPVSTSATAKS